MTTITLTVPDELAATLRALDTGALREILKLGLAQYQADRTLETYLPLLKTDNIIAAAHQTKVHSQSMIGTFVCL